MARAKNPRNDLIKNIGTRLGAGMVDVELDPDHYNVAVDKAITRYRMRSSNSMEYAGLFVKFTAGQQTYTLPEEVYEVRKIYRRSVGGDSGTGSEVDPFDLSFTNLYILQAGRYGGLANYEAFRQFQETAGRLFGSELNFHWNRNSKELQIFRNIKNDERVLIETYNENPESTLLEDRYSKDWIEHYSLAQCKFILGEARSKFGSLPGPAGGVSLNGDALKQESVAEMEKLEQELLRYAEGGEPPTFIIG